MPGEESASSHEPSAQPSSHTGQGDTSQPRQSPTVMGHITGNWIDALLWFTRIFTIISTFLYIIPLLGNQHTFYQRALISNAASSALRLHQRLPPFQMSREFFAAMIVEDSCHYLFYSILFLGSNPVSMALAPIFFFALLHAKTYTRTLLNIMGSGSLQFLHNLLNKLEHQQVNLLRFIACSEIFLQPASILMMFTGNASLILPFIYYRFLTLRYSSRRNPYCRQMFAEIRLTVETLISRPGCPSLIRNICTRGIGFVSRLAPQVATS